MEQQDQKLHEIWAQKTIPVVYRQGKSKPILLRLLYADNNRDWLKGDHKRAQHDAVYSHKIGQRVNVG